MVAITFCLTTFVVLATLGFHPSQASNACTMESIYVCRKAHTDDDCKALREFPDCVAKLDDDCSSYAESDKKYYLEMSRTETEVCEGMAEGECFTGARRKCYNYIPELYMYFDIQDGNKEYCGKYLELFNSYISCLDNLVNNCKVEENVKDVERSRNWAQDQLHVCD